MRKTLALLAGLSAIAAAHSAGAETLKVAVAQRGFWNSTFIEVGLKQGYFKEDGLDIEILYTEGGASTLTPVIAGSIDIAMTNGIARRGRGLCQGHAGEDHQRRKRPARADAFWYARPESGIKALADTNGKTVAFSSPGSSTNLILLQLINQAKATPKLVGDRRRARHAHAGDVRTDRRRLVGAAVRAAATRGRQGSASSRAAATSPRSRNRPSA